MFNHQALRKRRVGERDRLERARIVYGEWTPSSP
jgi:hypothetical protein